MKKSNYPSFLSDIIAEQEKIFQLCGGKNTNGCHDMFLITVEILEF